MAFVVHWYDSFCFAIIVIAIAVSAWMIRKGSRHDDDDDDEEEETGYESFQVVNGTAAVVCGGDRVRAMSSDCYLGSSQLWESCWLGLHPGWLLGFRLVAAVAMTVILLLDVRKYDSSIMLYYTEILGFLLGIEMHEEVDGAGYWMRWQVAVCAAIIAVPAAAAVAVVSRAKGQPIKAADLWIPCWGGVHPLWLLGFRGVVFVAMALLLSRMVLVHGLSTFFFYTQWTFTLVIIYFTIATFISAHGCWVYSKQTVSENGETNRFLHGDVEQNNPPTLISNKNKAATRLQSHYERIQNEKIAGFWGYLMQVIYQTSAGAVLLTDVVFWGILVPFLSSAHFSVNPIMVGMHSLNAVFLLVDTALNNLPFPWFRMAYFVFWSCIYVIFQWVLHACGVSWWPYPFLELGTPWAPLWYLCMALVHVPCYGIYWLIVKAKSSYFPKLFPNLYISCH